MDLSRGAEQFEPEKTTDKNLLKKVQKALDLHMTAFQERISRHEKKPEKVEAGRKVPKLSLRSIGPKQMLK